MVNVFGQVYGQELWIGIIVMVNGYVYGYVYC